MRSITSLIISECVQARGWFMVRRIFLLLREENLSDFLAEFKVFNELQLHSINACATLLI